jgi:hypothetical protein
MKVVAIVQSNYIPWKGYFDLINLSDEFILFDDVQYTPRDWRNRNRIKTPTGVTWLTIPVEVKGKRFQKIRDTLISEPDWNRRHWQTLVHSYSAAKYFSTYRSTFEPLYLGMKETSLSRVNYTFLKAICELLGCKTKISWSMDYEIIEGKTERLLSLCQQVGADVYLSGPAARGYIQEDLFENAGIQVRYMDYSGYAEYPQLHGLFDHAVTVLDLLFNTGPDACKYLKSFTA